MKRPIPLIVFLATVFMLAGGKAFCWEIAYEGNVLPNDPSLASHAWIAKDTPSNWYYYDDVTVENGMLHLVDNRSDRAVLYYREGAYLPTGTDVTIEARVKVVSTVLPYPGALAAWFGTSIYGQGAFLGLYPDKICTHYDGSNYPEWYSIDLTEFHTLRIAVNAAEERFQVWVDGVGVFDGVSSGGGGVGGVFFGVQELGARVDTYWDYVRYSKEFLPIPEPASLTALLALSLLAAGGVLRGRKR